MHRMNELARVSFPHLITSVRLLGNPLPGLRLYATRQCGWFSICLIGLPASVIPYEPFLMLEAPLAVHNRRLVFCSRFRRGGLMKGPRHAPRIPSYTYLAAEKR